MCSSSQRLQQPWRHRHARCTSLQALAGRSVCSSCQSLEGEPAALACRRISASAYHEFMFAIASHVARTLTNELPGRQGASGARQQPLRAGATAARQASSCLQPTCSGSQSLAGTSTRLVLQAWGQVTWAQVAPNLSAEQVDVPEMAVLQRKSCASWHWQSTCTALNSAAQPGKLFTAYALDRRAATRCIQHCAQTSRQTGGPLAGVSCSICRQAITRSSRYSLLAVLWASEQTAICIILLCSMIPAQLPAVCCCAV